MPPPIAASNEHLGVPNAAPPALFPAGILRSDKKKNPKIANVQEDLYPKKVERLAKRKTAEQESREGTSRGGAETVFDGSKTERSSSSSSSDSGGGRPPSQKRRRAARGVGLGTLGSLPL